MKFANVVLSGIAHHLPSEIISSDNLELQLAPIYQRLRLPEGRLELMTGIKERRVWPNGTKPSDLSTQAAKNLFEKIDIPKEKIAICIHASVCRDMLEPSTASFVHHNLELPAACTSFDLSNACLGVLSAMMMVGNLIESGAIKHGLIVTGENSGPLLYQTIQHLLNDQTITRKSIKKYIASLTIGSAATAILLSHRDESSSTHQLLSGHSLSDTSANIFCKGDGDTNSLMMETDSEELLKAGVKLASENWKLTKEELAWNNSDVNWAVGHQVGSAHEKLIMESLELSNHPTFTTYETLGNTGSAALPVTLSLMAEKEMIKKDENVALLGIGSGLHSIMMGIKW